MAKKGKAKKKAAKAKTKPKAEEAVEFEQEGDSLMVDFDNVEDSAYEALPKGRYGMVVEECEFTYSQAGNPMWTMKLEVEEGEYAGRKLFSHMVMAGKGMPITKKQLARIAPHLLEGPFDPEDEEIIEQMVGLRVVAQVTTKKYEGEWTNNIKNLYPAEDDDDFS